VCAGDGTWPAGVLALELTGAVGCPDPLDDAELGDL